MSLAKSLAFQSTQNRSSSSASVGDFGLRMRFSAIRGQFLDRQQIMSRYDKAAIRGINRFGATTRMIARRSMRVRTAKATFSQFDPELLALVGGGRKRGGDGKFLSNASYDISPWPLKKSRPGAPPFARTRELRDKIFYIADRTRRSVVIGPQIRSFGDNMGSLEHGGEISKPQKEWVKFYDGGQAKIRLVPKGGRRVRLKARPYMKPAYDQAVDKLVPGIWKNSI